MEQGMRTFSKSLTVLGSILLIGCVGYLMVGWFSDERWGWVAIGVIVIAANLGVLFVQLKPTPAPRDWSVEEVRTLIEPVHGEMAQIRTLRRADKGLPLAKAVELVAQARISSGPA